MSPGQRRSLHRKLVKAARLITEVADELDDHDITATTRTALWAAELQITHVAKSLKHETPPPPEKPIDPTTLVV